MSGDEVAKRVAALFPNRFLRGYVRGKLRSDPVYAAAAAALRSHPHPLFDLGCGIALLGGYLRESGFEPPIVGVDHDARKISVAEEVARRYAGMQFRTGDIRDPFPAAHSVAALDILHYFQPAEQKLLLERIADAVPAGGVALIRDCVRDDSLRYRLTMWQERFSRAIRWLRAERLNFASRDEIAGPFLKRGFTADITPLWGRTPFNNYLFVFRRSGEGTTKE